MNAARRIPPIALLCSALVLLTNASAHAGSATWNLNPTSSNWNTAANWTPNTVPDGPTDTATFDVSANSRVSLSDGVEVFSLVFNPGASAFTLSAKSQFTLTISGPGIINESSERQEFVAAAGSLFGGQVSMAFRNSATAGDNTRFTARGANTDQSGGGIFFYDTSSAGSGDFIAHGPNGLVVFVGNSTAANATFTTYASTSVEPGGVIAFDDDSTAANATIINNGTLTAGTRPGTTAFDNASTAGDADLIAYSGVPGAQGGIIYFGTDSTGGTARVTIFGNSKLDISGHNPPGITIGSLQGDGLVFLGANNLTVNSSNLDETFSGAISDHGDFGGIKGSFTKMGAGDLNSGFTQHLHRSHDCEWRCASRGERDWFGDRHRSCAGQRWGTRRWGHHRGRG